MVKVSVLGPSGLHLDLVLEDGARCLALKEELAELEGVPVERQNLLFAGHTLRDDATLESYSLSDYNLRDDGITITLQVSTVGRVFLQLPDGHLTASDIEEDTQELIGQRSRRRRRPPRAGTDEQRADRDAFAYSHEAAECGDRGARNSRVAADGDVCCLLHASARCRKAR